MEEFRRNGREDFLQSLNDEQASVNNMSDHQRFGGAMQRSLNDVHQATRGMSSRFDHQNSNNVQGLSSSLNGLRTQNTTGMTDSFADRNSIHSMSQSLNGLRSRGVTRMPMPMSSNNDDFMQQEEMSPSQLQAQALHDILDRGITGMNGIVQDMSMSQSQSLLLNRGGMTRRMNNSTAIDEMSQSINTSSIRNRGAATRGVNRMNSNESLLLNRDRG
eukprot:CAMPEP_0171049072 /NCGR_PEP_ID=MMETSP0736-20130129/51391_1 /TAXON_ID=186038 /ORGANISM="Fragilariopsis kerguelensis, Strain L26-C5" /LENGTH=216 /DNA_ID=CAMNT_0011501191 /DNA_START=194 /DNA_END=842 /DNA_ORIENTATION=-